MMAAIPCSYGRATLIHTATSAYPHFPSRGLLTARSTLPPRSVEYRRPHFPASRACCTLPPRSVEHRLPRRNLIGFLLLADPHWATNFALADVATGYKQYVDNLDGYSFSYPQGWVQVRGAGADVFFRDPIILDENVSVEISSPSSSRFKTVDELGSPDEAAQKVLRQYLTEFMSTRLGVRRESKIVSTASRIADDGRIYYDIQVNVKSYANNQQLAIMPQDRVVQLEWNRRYLSVLGVENSRLYELRLQAPENVLAKEEGDLQRIMDSFRVFEV